MGGPGASAGLGGLEGSRMSVTTERWGRGGAALLIGASVWMAIGGITQGLLGIDYWTALEDGTLAEALSSADGRTLFQMTHVMWAFGMLLFVIAYTLVRRHLQVVADHPLLDVAFHVVVMGATFNVVSYLAMASVTSTFAGATDITGAEGLLRMGLRLDDYATLMMLGLGPLLLSISGRGSWAPTWLIPLSALALVANVGLVISAFVGGAGIVLTPAVVIGVIATIAIGVCIRAHGS